MSATDATGGFGGSGQGGPTEEQLRAAYEAQMKQIRVEQLIVEQAVTLLDFGMRRLGLEPGTEDERDPAQVRLAIEGIRALMPLLEGLVPGDQLGGFRNALSRLQMEFVRIGRGEAPDAAGTPDSAGTTAAAGDPGETPAPPASATPGANPEEPGPAQRSGRLWVPGQ